MYISIFINPNQLDNQQHTYWISIMEKGVILTYKNIKREFFISGQTKPHIINVLIRRAFHLTSQIKQLRHPRGYIISINEVFQLQNGKHFEVVTDDQASGSKEKSENYSQKNMAKSSGRKFPPSEKQLLDSKFFIEDFQLFMAQVSTHHVPKHYGIIFFSSKKKAQFLGKKILRELVFQFDKIQFFYALHPIKTHTNSALLGQMLLFTIFKGKKMIVEREFTENTSAIEQITGYLKSIIKSGKLSLQGNKQEGKPKNLIFLQEQRSYDQKLQEVPLNSLDTQFEEIKNLELFKLQSLTPNKVNAPITEIKHQSEIKSHLTNQISFETQFYQPSWFTESDSLNRIQKSFISALIKAKDSNFINLCNGIDLKNDKKLSLNITLIKVFLKELIDEKFSGLKQNMKLHIQLNQQNRQSPIFSFLLKLNKFGSITQFVEATVKYLKTYFTQVRLSYIDIAKQIKKKSSSFGIRLMNCEKDEEEKQDSPNNNLIGKSEQLHLKNYKIAELFHKMPIETLQHQKTYSLPGEFNEAETAIIREKILKGDPFLIQNYIPNKWKHNKTKQLGVPIVRNYLQSNVIRYKILQDLITEPQLRCVLTKIQLFRSLLYFLYKQRIINRKHQKIFLYLYIWSDLNLLGAFELYLMDRNLEQLIETIYNIDYTYYLLQKYGLEMSEVEKFSLQVELQLIMLLIFSPFIRDVRAKIAIQKFIRAGDQSLLEIVKQNHQDKDKMIKTITQFGETKKQELAKIAKREIDYASQLQELKNQRKTFLQQIIPIHFKKFKDYSLAAECIQLQEPLITSIFTVYESTKQLVDWIQSFQLYILKLNQIHMQLIINNLAKQEKIQGQVLKCPTDIIKGIYEVYLITKDTQDTKDSLKRAATKFAKQL